MDVMTDAVFSFIRHKMSVFLYEEVCVCRKKYLTAW